MGVSADVVAEALRAQGVTEEDIEEATGIYAQAKYEPKTIQIAPAYWLESDHTVRIGKEDVVLRCANGEDLERLLFLVIELVRMFAAESGDDRGIEEILKETNPQGVFSQVIEKLWFMERAKGGGYPEWYVAVLEEICSLINYGDDKYTPGHIIAMPWGQRLDLFLKLWQVNEQDFLGLWGRVPQSIRLWISTLASPIISSVSQLIGSLKPLESSSGGQESTGKSSTSSPSEKKALSAKANSKSAA